MYGDAEWVRRQEERRAREAAMDADQNRRGEALDALMRAAENDLEASRLVTLARIIRPDDFACRASMLESARRMRSSPRGNDPDYQAAIETQERVGQLSIETAITKAQQILALVRSWD